MSYWKYKLDFEGKYLRRLIEKEKTIKNIINIYNQLIVCIESWNKKLKQDDKEYWEYGIQTMIEDLQISCPDIEDKNLSYKEEEDKLNYHLEDFYDMCDAAKVRIGI